MGHPAYNVVNQAPAGATKMEHLAQMGIVSARTLRILAALVWYIGALVLIIKGSSLLMEAAALKPAALWPAAAGAIGLLLGGLKARYIFRRSIYRNLNRIAALGRPRIWLFFSPGFFVALAVMIAAGVTLSRLAHGHYGFLLGVAALDISIGAALLASSYVYWKERAFA